MNKIFLLISIVFYSLSANSQVTQINNNSSLDPTMPFPNGKTILVSDIDSTLWITDGTLAGTTPLPTTIKFIAPGGFLNGKFIFTAKSNALGIELYYTDGTNTAPTLLKDINPGAPDSEPDDDFAILNGYMYFTASRPTEGRELWRTDGTFGGTDIFKDLVAGPTSSNDPNDYHLFSNGSFLLFDVKTAADGNELWISNGTAGNGMQLKNINSGAVSSDPDNFTKFNSLVLFQANDGTHGIEYWRTDGTEAGTFLLRDINPGLGNVYLFFNLPFIFNFNGKAYFNAYNPTTGNEVWMTDGTEANTAILRDIQILPFGFSTILNAVKLGNNFFFSSSDFATRFEIWKSDGTPDGTTLFMSFDPADPSGSPFLMPPYDIDYNSQTLVQNPFQGNKFFFTAGTSTDGNELWVSDGTPGGTHQVKNIGPGATNGVNASSFVYTSNFLYFVANNGTDGAEPWKSDGTDGGTSQVANINPGDDSDPLYSFFINNGKLFFNATDGNSPTATDLYVLDGVFPLPINLVDFTVSEKTGNALINWSTSVEIINREFVIERSLDGTHFTAIGTTKPSLTAFSKKAYSFTDWNIGSLGVNKIFYRLRQLDKDGSATVSRIVALTIKGSKLFALKIIGNPATSFLTVEISGNNDKVQLGIRDVNGRSLSLSSTYNGNGFVSLPISNLKPGIYFLVAETGEGQKTLKFIKK